jgi:hypothetical protein
MPKGVSGCGCRAASGSPLKKNKPILKQVGSAGILPRNRLSPGLMGGILPGQVTRYDFMDISSFLQRGNDSLTQIVLNLILLSA